MTTQNNTGRGGDGLDGGMTLGDYLHQPTPRERYRRATGEAAACERAGALALAVEWWQAAGELALSAVDRHWCDSRAESCARRVRERQG